MEDLETLRLTPDFNTFCTMSHAYSSSFSECIMEKRLLLARDFDILRLTPNFETLILTPDATF